MLRTIAFLVCISTILSGCLLEPTTTISEGTDKKNLGTLNIQKANVYTNFISSDERWNTFDVVSIDNQPISIFSNKIRISPGPHSMDIICEFGHGADSAGNTDWQSEHRTIQFTVKPSASYEILLNLPNPSAYYPHPCQYMRLKETATP